MKLYTKEQVTNVWQKYWLTAGVSNELEKILEQEKSIELPSDEEIQDAANEYAENKKRIKNLSNREFDLSKNDFIKATKWFKEQITKTK